MSVENIEEIEQLSLDLPLVYYEDLCNMGVCKTRNTPEHPRNTPGTPRNIPGTPPGTARNTPEQPCNTLGTSHNTPNTLETARNTPGAPKIVVSGQTAHELTKPKTSEDSQFLIRLLRITLRFPSISRILGIFSKLKNSEKTIN